jgi:preprotein translocase subunit SecY
MYLQARQLSDRKRAERRTAAAHFPIPLNASGMMPLILTGALYYGLLPGALELCGAGAGAAALRAFQASGAGLVAYGALVFAMEFVPVGGPNPAEAAEYLSMINVGIKGVAPGANTVDHLKAQLLRCKFWGGLALGGLAVAAQVFDVACREAMGATLATTSLLIIVGAVLQTARQVQALLEGPALQARLERERAVISSLTLT